MLNSILRRIPLSQLDWIHANARFKNVSLHFVVNLTTDVYRGR